MKRMKKITTLLLAGALALGVGAFAACGEDEATAYTLMVKDADGNAMSNYQITICTLKEDGSKGSCMPPLTTDENGKVVFEVEKGSYAVSDTNEDDNLVLQEEYHLSEYGTTEVVIVTK